MVVELYLWNVVPNEGYGTLGLTPYPSTAGSHIKTIFTK